MKSLEQAVKVGKESSAPGYAVRGEGPSWSWGEVEHGRCMKKRWFVNRRKLLKKRRLGRPHPKLSVGRKGSDDSCKNGVAYSARMNYIYRKAGAFIRAALRTEGV